MVKLINIILLITLSISSYAQVNVIKVDSSNQVIIYNNGTLIENNGGTVNVENKVEEVPKNGSQNDYMKVYKSDNHSNYCNTLNHEDDDIYIIGSVIIIMITIIIFMILSLKE